MRKYITKTVKFTTISAQEITIKDGNVTGVALPDFTVTGDYDIDRAESVAKKHYKGKNVVVTAVSGSETVYRLSTEKFLEMAEEVTQENEADTNVEMVDLK